MSDIAEEIETSWCSRLGCEEERLIDDAADRGSGATARHRRSHDVLRRKIGIDIPNHVASSLVTVGDTVECIASLVAMSAESGQALRPPTMGLGQTLWRYFGPRKLAGV